MLRYEATDAETAAALPEHAELIADEVLATDYAAGRPDWPGAEPFADETLGLSFWFRKA